MPRPARLDDVRWLRRQYVDRGLTQAEIAAQLDCAPGTVRLALQRHGIEIRPTPLSARQIRPTPGLNGRIDRLTRTHARAVDMLATADELAIQVWRDGASLQQIGDARGCSPEAVSQFFKRRDLERQP